MIIIVFRLAVIQRQAEIDRMTLKYKSYRSKGFLTLTVTHIRDCKRCPLIQLLFVSTHHDLFSSNTFALFSVVLGKASYANYLHGLKEAYSYPRIQETM